MTRTDGRRHDKAIAAAQSLGPAFASIAAASRTDPAVFCQFVLRDEATGQPIELAPMHEEWHDLFTRHARLVLWTHTEGGKTTMCSIGRVLWEIGRNPNIRILVLSAASGGAKKIAKAIKNYIENSVEYHLVFPGVAPDKSDTTGAWRDDSFIIRRTSRSKDPTVQAAGYGGDVLGSRYDLIIIDDYLTAENTYSDHNRQKYYSWLKSTIEGRRTADGRLWFIGNAWHLDDAMHRYAAEPGTHSRRFPVVDDGVLSWPAVWPASRVEAEIVNRGPIESRRSLFCDPVSDAERRFKLEYIMSALINGDGLELAYALTYVPSGFRTVTGVDLAVTKKTSGDLTALVTIAVEEKRQIRSLLDVTSGRWSGPEIVNAIIDVNSRYNSLVVVESNGAQRYLKQFTNERSAVPVRAFYTGRNKYDPSFGIESLAVEFSAGKWVLPNRGGERAGIHATMHPEVKALIGEMLRYDPTSHTGDRLMACWLAREGARMGNAPAGMGKRRRRT
jgi:hypothetical protein